MKKLILMLALLIPGTTLAADSIEFRHQWMSPVVQAVTGYQVTVVPGAYRLTIQGEGRACRITVATLADVDQLKMMIEKAGQVICTNFSQDPNVHADQLWLDLGK
jgi:hypothetical protein